MNKHIDRRINCVYVFRAQSCLHQDVDLEYKDLMSCHLNTIDHSNI